MSRNLDDLPLRWLQWVRNRLHLREGLRIFTVAQRKNGPRKQNSSPLPIILFRWEKYRLIPPLESFLIFHFSTIIAVLESPWSRAKYTIYRPKDKKGRAERACL
jgi:hypothetical protein